MYWRLESFVYNNITRDTFFSNSAYRMNILFVSAQTIFQCFILLIISSDLVRGKSSTERIPDSRIYEPDPDLEIDVKSLNISGATECLKTGNLTGLKGWWSSYLAKTGGVYADGVGCMVWSYMDVFTFSLFMHLQGDLFDLHQNNLKEHQNRFLLEFLPQDLPIKGIALEFAVAESEKDLQKVAEKALEDIKTKKYILEYPPEKRSAVVGGGMAFYRQKMEVASTRNLNF